MELQVSAQVFEQTFLRREKAMFSENQQRSFCNVLSGYTSDFAESFSVNTNCSILDQDLRATQTKRNLVFSNDLGFPNTEQDGGEMEWRRGNSRRDLQGLAVFTLKVKYQMNYTSSITSVNGYANEFFGYMNQRIIKDDGSLEFVQLKNFESDLRFQGITVESAAVLTQVIKATPSPTMASSFSPTLAHSTSLPSSIPTASSFPPSTVPSSIPTESSSAPSFVPSIRPTIFPSNPPSRSPRSSVGPVIGAVICVLFFFLYMYYLRYKKIKREANIARISDHQSE